MAKKNEGSNSDCEEEEEIQPLKLQRKSNVSSSVSNSVMPSQKKVEITKGEESESESESESEDDGEEESSEEEAEETSTEGKEDASREAPKSAVAQGSESNSDSESDSGEVKKTSSKGKEEENQESEESSSGDEERRQLRTKKKMVLPLIDTPGDEECEESDDDEDETEPEPEPKSNAAKQIVPEKKPAPKRPAENVEINPRDSKRATPSLPTALKPFERKWSENDEILLLEEMIKNKLNKTVDSSAPCLELNVDSCHFDFQPNSKQLKEKISKMKRKYKKNTEKPDHSAMKPHDVQVFELSRKLWGDLGNGVASEARKIQEAGKINKVVDAKPIQSYYTPGGMIGGVMDSAANEALKEGFELVREPQPWESDQCWTELRIQECKLYAKKVDLMQEQWKLGAQRLNLMKEQVSLTAENLQASLSEQKDEE